MIVHKCLLYPNNFNKLILLNILSAEAKSLGDILDVKSSYNLGFNDSQLYASIMNIHDRSKGDIDR